MASLLKKIPFLVRKSNYLYAFIDESGNDDFSPTGSKYWVITSLLTTDIQPGAEDLYDLKHEIIDRGIDLEYFHASKDKPIVRDRVFDILSRLNNVRVDSVVVEKRKTGPSLRPKGRFYPMMVENLLKYSFDPRGLDVTNFDKVLVFLDRAGASPKHRKALVKAIKRALKPYLAHVPYTICMHQSKSHPYLQMVDYYCWAIARKWEHSKPQPYQRIRHLITSEFDIFRPGTDIWY